MLDPCLSILLVLIQQVVQPKQWCHCPCIWFEYKNLRLHGSHWIFRSSRPMERITAKQIQVLVPSRRLSYQPPRDMHQSYFPHRKLSVTSARFRNKLPPSSTQGYRITWRHTTKHSRKQSLHRGEGQSQNFVPHYRTLEIIPGGGILDTP